jgi:hypothetical protein
VKNFCGPTLGVAKTFNNVPSVKGLFPIFWTNFFLKEIAIETNMNVDGSDDDGIHATHQHDAKGLPIGSHLKSKSSRCIWDAHTRGVT